MDIQKIKVQLHHAIKARDEAIRDEIDARQRQLPLPMMINRTALRCMFEGKIAALEELLEEIDTDEPDSVINKAPFVIWVSDEDAEQLAKEMLRYNDGVVKMGFPESQKTPREYLEWLLHNTLVQARIRDTRQQEELERRKIEAGYYERDIQGE